MHIKCNKWNLDCLRRHWFKACLRDTNVSHTVPYLSKAVSLVMHSFGVGMSSSTPAWPLKPRPKSCEEVKENESLNQSLIQQCVMMQLWDTSKCHLRMERQASPEDSQLDDKAIRQSLPRHTPPCLPRTDPARSQRMPHRGPRRVENQSEHQMYTGSGLLSGLGRCASQPECRQCPEPK